MFILVVQSSWWGRESWLLCLTCFCTWAKLHWKRWKHWHSALYFQRKSQIADSCSLTIIRLSVHSATHLQKNNKKKHDSTDLSKRINVYHRVSTQFYFEMHCCIVNQYRKDKRRLKGFNNKTQHWGNETVDSYLNKFIFSVLQINLKWTNCSCVTHKCTLFNMKSKRLLCILVSRF